MKRLALLTLLLMPSVAWAQRTDEVQTAPDPIVQPAPSGAIVDDPVAPYQPEVAVAAMADQGFSARYRPAETLPGGWFGDVGFYVLRPQWSGGNPAFATTTTTDVIVPGDPSINDRITTFDQTDFDHDSSFAPLVSIGYAGRNGLGVRARWWTLAASDSVGGSALTGELPAGGLPGFVTTDFIVPSLLGTTTDLSIIPELIGAGPSYNVQVDGSFRNRLDLDVIDAEGIWDTTIGRSSLLLSAGVRYAHIGQSFDGDLVVATDAVAANAALRSHHTFNGAGPTVALHAHRVIGQTNFSVYGLSRGSLLYGESRQRATTSFEDRWTVDLDLTRRTVSNSASIRSDSLRPVVELEVGTNWTRSLGAFDLFVESGLVGMVWFNTGNAANSDALIGSGFGTAGVDSANATAGFIGTAFGTDGSDSSSHNLGLIGLRFSTGIRF